MVDLQTQVRRVRDSNEAVSEVAEERSQLTEYDREAENWTDSQTAAHKTTKQLRNQLGELHFGRSRLEAEATGLKARVAELMYELAAIVAENFVPDSAKCRRLHRNPSGACCDMDSGNFMCFLVPASAAVVELPVYRQNFCGMLLADSSVSPFTV